MDLQQAIEKSADFIHQADALLISAGAGIGVDSGLPDFRGREGFWRAYPFARKLGVSFEQMANPRWFEQDPHLAWAFYGHRLNLYRQTTPHKGLQILLNWAKSKTNGYFVFTSNVDGQFQKAGFPENKIVEVHGSIHHLQCTLPCDRDIWPAGGVEIKIDMNSFRALDPLPKCPYCGRVARPNILMFGDWSWVSLRTDAQEASFEAWLSSLREKKANLAIIEIGAGTAVPTVRMTCENLAITFDAPLIRINPREPDIYSSIRGVSIPLGALVALERINDLLTKAN